MQPVLDGFQRSCSLQEEFLLLNLVTIDLILTFLGKVGGFAQSLGNFCFPTLPGKGGAHTVLSIVLAL